MKKIINKFKTTHFDIAAGPMLLVFGGVVFIFIAVAVVCVLLAIKFIKKAKTDYQKLASTQNMKKNKEDDHD
ncbi:MAG: hypothetical protein R3Y65_04320 [Bacillota bacterium]